MLNKN